MRTPNLGFRLGVNQCSTDFKSWKMVPKELKKFIVGELSVSFCIFMITNLFVLALQVHWDVDETDKKQRKNLDDLFKMHFR
ncbi:hypothetical protein D8674_036491 [Pyrus ussuriensis x Pyrus communis]|uniref:Uncharacterized protein n=1 Tax=Pyrus ussuriensis x Pyrus communis TaxID=2448454 RepID=A0A5N5FQJ7_9ROSA|nr:hypothetical protein D8674_042449 [Pyrus ussuriensis x Pyrus communis]KAB2620510.1 hypothetical protein D8674_036491 [Pyrus ussuriensis x Pyrus communis]